MTKKSISKKKSVINGRAGNYWLGAHVSAQGGVQNAPLNAAAIGANAFALFVKNQRQWQVKPLAEADIVAFRDNCKAHNFSPEQILPHAGYLINLTNPDDEARKKSLDSFINELERCKALDLTMLNVHPGSHLGKMEEVDSLKRIAESINIALNESEGVKVVLENTAGQGSSLGHRFEHLAAIIEGVEVRSRVGICLDTAHTLAAGYEIRKRDAYEEVMADFGAKVGFEFLSGMHLNDSKADLGSRVDRHHSLGEGFMGMELFELIMNDSRLHEIPLLLETIDDTIWPDELALLRRLQQS